MLLGKTKNKSQVKLGTVIKVGNKPLGIIGIYPPPFGGVGIHLKRLVNYLSNNSFDFVFYNTGPNKVEHPNIVNVGWSLRWYLKLLFVCKHQVIHSHTGRWWARCAIGLIGLVHRTRIVYTAHSYSFCEEFLKGNPLRRWAVRTILKQASTIVAVNEKIKDELLKIGIPKEKVALIPAFVPPPSDKGENKLPIEVSEFCKGKAPILVACGAFILRDGQDVYGLEAMVNMMESLLNIYPDAVLIVYLGGTLTSNEDDFKQLLHKINSGPLKSHVLFYNSSEEFYPVLRVADVFLRPTLTDGDAISVREALCLGVPTLVSNAVSRPEGSITYPTNNLSAFVETLVQTIRNLPAHKERIKHVKINNPCAKLVAIFDKLAEPK